ncbi:iron uptake regulator [Oxalicibacterium flavum]|uniref:Iron uptake regulator n=1 Tax=Oxalicibacterium flavum TaxID=179467 RepID=A0A8J2XWY5_9BURK|nr:FecR domain-containing protein [Oxalicibacterium flavum]GGC02543.1 iron uptake regulator [Oxalicibacterium flavum]
MPDAPSVAESVSLQAVQWLVALQAPDATADTHAACRRWRAESEAHEQAWQHIESFRAQLAAFDPLLVHGTLTRSASAARQRRQSLKLLAVLAVAGGGVWMAGRSTPAQAWLADYRTAPGERRTLTLADGTQLVMGSATAVDLRFDAQQRLVTLLEGDILITTAADPQAASHGARPFLVDTPDGRLRALGTRFEVRHWNADTSVGVYEGAVEVSPRNAAAGVRVLQAGERTHFTHSHIAESEVLPDVASPLATGMFVAREMPLADFLAELERYRRGHLSCDPAIAELKVSGIYPLDDTERVLDMLLRTLPIEMQSWTRYWVRLRPRSDSV